MIGAIIGDIVGSRFEFNNHRRKEFELFTDKCEVTDDSIMTLCVAKAIMETSRIYIKKEKEFYPYLEKMTVKYMQDIGQNYPNCGYGGMFQKWIFSIDSQPYNSFGNGAAMRISPVGFFAESENEVKMLSKSITKVSHNHSEGIKGAEAAAMALFLAKQGCTKQEITDYISEKNYTLDFTIDEIRDTYKFSETYQETVPQAIEAFLESCSFEDAIRTAVSVGGDSDTLAAITGAIAEAYYGVPDDIRQKTLSYLDKTLLQIYNEWYRFQGQN